MPWYNWHTHEGATKALRAQCTSAHKPLGSHQLSQLCTVHDATLKHVSSISLVSPAFPDYDCDNVPSAYLTESPLTYRPIKVFAP
ncbi:hypothetical protein GOP47_0020987 [Adiantum capillus-veneris]|uniref:Uncharacterized protein n=1 Tax=Adiantum capillus-veneris TaxID=13818 RepID=A0A9D4UB06_ADICA|nr:hypothetical protein GOP47_0020987 [Adiantum capillus-veneris]